MTFSYFHAGTLPVGSVKVEEISAQEFNVDKLQGHTLPGGLVDHIPEPYNFFYEVVEDGRSGIVEERSKFRLLNLPFRRPGKLDFTIMLERVSEDRNRLAKNVMGSGEEG